MKKYIIIAAAVLLIIALIAAYLVLTDSYTVILNKNMLSDRVGLDLTGVDVLEVASKQTENGNELCVVLDMSPSDFAAKKEVQTALSKMPSEEDEAAFTEKLDTYIAMRTAFSAQFNISMQYITHYCYVDLPNTKGETSRIYWYATDYEGEHLVFLYSSDVGKKLLSFI